MNIWEKRINSAMFVPYSLTQEQQEHTAKPTKISSRLELNRTFWNASLL